MWSDSLFGGQRARDTRDYFVTKMLPKLLPERRSGSTKEGDIAGRTYKSRGGEIGKHRGLKIPRPKGLAGSNPALGMLVITIGQPDRAGPNLASVAWIAHAASLLNHKQEWLFRE